jgi:hypothetical protein
LLRERIREKELEEEVKRRAEERERIRLKQLEYQKKMEEDRKVREAAEIERKHKEAKEKRVTESFLTHFQQFYESQLLIGISLFPKMVKMERRS